MSFSFCALNLKGMLGLFSGVSRWTLRVSLRDGTVIANVRRCCLEAARTTRELLRSTEGTEGNSLDAMLT